MSAVTGIGRRRREPSLWQQARTQWLNVRVRGIDAGTRVVLNLGYLTVGLYILTWILPTSFLQTLRMSYLGVGALFTLLALARIRQFPAVTFPAFALLVMQTWSIFTQFYALNYLGRGIGFGRAETFLTEALVPYFVAYAMVSLAPESRRVVFRMVLAAFALSCAVGLMQFLRLGPAMSLANLYTYKAIDNWDGTSGIRAVGLTFQPNQLAFQAIVGLAFFVAKTFVGKLSKLDVVAILFFTGGAVSTQARSAYIVLGLLWVVLMVRLWHIDRPLFGRMAMVIALGLMAVVAVGARRFGYLFQSSSVEEDTSFRFRTEFVWSQVDHIYPQLFFTGVGPSNGLMLNTGPEDKWVPMGRILESGYLLMLCMYGIPGLFLYATFLLGSIGSAVRRMTLPTSTPVVRRTLATFAAMIAFMVVNSYTFNTVDGYLIFPCTLLFAGLTVDATRNVKF
jgi:hypothetical protein